MTARPKPPEVYEENPPLDADFFTRAKPAVPGENARLRKALQKIIEAHESGARLEEAIADARVIVAP